MSNEIELLPSYWASVSGGKDSLYMLDLILHNLDRYPLTGVVHFELEIDYPFIKDVIDYMESECKRISIKFVRIKPQKTWQECYSTVSSKTNNIYGFPTRKSRWCNSMYKLNARKQLEGWMESIGYYTIFYIGYCVDEEKRFAKRTKGRCREIYPLVENNIKEDTIWEWAKREPIFNHYYETQKRCGCMYCPLSTYLENAYLFKYYPNHFKFMIDRMRETEQIREQELGKPFAVKSSNPKYNADYIERIVRTKWLKRLEEKEEKFANERNYMAR